jgi:hypothetical protein
MGRIEKIYRMRRGVLFAAFVCSIFLCGTFCLFPPFARLKTGGHLSFLSESTTKNVFLFSGICLSLILLILVVRFLIFRAVTRRDSGTRAAVDDEHVRAGWLRAYRAAGLTVIAIHAISLVAPGALYYGIGFPSEAYTSFSLGLAVLFGSAIFFTRVNQK